MKKFIPYIAVGVFLITVIPLGIYFGVQQRQSTSGKAQDACGGVCDGNPTQAECLDYSVCRWNGTSCICSLPTITPMPTDSQCGGVCTGNPTQAECLDYFTDGCRWNGTSCICSPGTPTVTIAPTVPPTQPPTQPPPQPTQPPGGGITCVSNSQGNTITNNTDFEVNCEVTYASCQSSRATKEECLANDACQGIPTTVPLNLAPFESKIVGPIQPMCDAWQADNESTLCTTVQGQTLPECRSADNGCVWDDNICNGVTPTLPPGGQCLLIKMFDDQWVRIYDFTTLQAGQTVIFTALGNGGTFDAGRFRINGGAWMPSDTGTTATSPTGEFYIEYTIPEGITNFTAEAMVHEVTQGWK